MKFSFWLKLVQVYCFVVPYTQMPLSNNPVKRANLSKNTGLKMNKTADIFTQKVVKQENPWKLHLCCKY